MKQSLKTWKKDADACFKELSEIQTKLDTRKAERDSAVNAVMTTHSPAINDLTEKYRAKEEELLEMLNDAGVFDAIKEEKTVDLDFGVCKFKAGREKIEFTTQGGEETAITRLMNSDLEQFIRVTRSLNKQGILADKALDNSVLKSYGMKKVKEDSVDYKLKEVAEAAV